MFAKSTVLSHVAILYPPMDIRTEHIGSSHIRYRFTRSLVVDGMQERKYSQKSFFFVPFHQNFSLKNEFFGWRMHVLFGLETVISGERSNYEKEKGRRKLFFSSA